MTGVEEVLEELATFRAKNGISGIITLTLDDRAPGENKMVQWNISIDANKMTKADWYMVVGTLERLKTQLTLEMIEGVETDGPAPQEGRR